MGDANTMTGSGRPIDLITVDTELSRKKYSVRFAMLVVNSIHVTESARVLINSLPSTLGPSFAHGRGEPISSLGRCLRGACASSSKIFN